MAVPIAESLSSTVTLNDGIVMPLFGLGVSKCEAGGQTKKVVDFALKTGYRLIDTAARYGNEADVGRSIQTCGLDRSDLFVVTKLWGADHGYHNTHKAFQVSLKKFGLDYIDLYLIHSPLGDKLVETYQAMLDLKEQGLVRSVGESNFNIQHIEGLRVAGKPLPSVNQIELHVFNRSVGVSNFNIQHIEGLLVAGKPLPSVNQIELHVWERKPELVQYCRDNSIALMGYSPLGKAKRMNDRTITEISKKYDKTNAQLLIRWSVQNRYITIPKSAKSERIVENAQVFDWEISDDDMTTLNSLPDWICGWDPTDVPWNG